MAEWDSGLLSYGISPAERKQAQAQGLLTLGAGLLAGSGPSLKPTSTGSLLGQALPGAMQAYQGSADNAIARKMRTQQIIDAKLKQQAFERQETAKARLANQLQYGPDMTREQTAGLLFMADEPAAATRYLTGDEVTSGDLVKVPGPDGRPIYVRASQALNQPAYVQGPTPTANQAASNNEILNARARLAEAVSAAKAEGKDLPAWLADRTSRTDSLGFRTTDFNAHWQRLAWLARQHLVGQDDPDAAHWSKTLYGVKPPAAEPPPATPNEYAPRPSLLERWFGGEEARPPAAATTPPAVPAPSRPVPLPGQKPTAPAQPGAPGSTFDERQLPSFGDSVTVEGTNFAVMGPPGEDGKIPVMALSGPNRGKSARVPATSVIGQRNQFPPRDLITGPGEDSDLSGGGPRGDMLEGLPPVDPDGTNSAIARIFGPRSRELTPAEIENARAALKRGDMSDAEIRRNATNPPGRFVAQGTRAGGLLDVESYAPSELNGRAPESHERGLFPPGSKAATNSAEENRVRLLRQKEQDGHRLTAAERNTIASFRRRYGFYPRTRTEHHQAE